MTETATNTQFRSWENLEMEFERALDLRDRFAPRARDVLVERQTRALSVEDGVVVGPDVQVSRPVALGVSVKGDDDFGLAVRTIGPPEDLPEEMLSEMLSATEGELDLLALDPIRPRDDKLRKRKRPVFPGLSVGHPQITAGTLGTIVRDRRDNGLAVLSNNHVLADSNSGNVGDPCLQPGVTDSGTTADEIGTLKRFVEVTKGAEVDAAIADLREEFVRPVMVGDSIQVTGHIRIAREALEVAKNGRTTGFTTGRISAVSLIDLEINFDGHLIAFDNQIEIRSPLRDPFSAPGDSGSLVVDLGGNAVGLLFAGTTSHDGRLDITYINPIDRVLDLLEIDLIS